MKRSRHDIPQVLATPWHSLFEEYVYKPRTRKRASYLDTIEPIVRWLEATGQLSTYAQPGVDPLEVIRARVEAGASE